MAMEQTHLTRIIRDPDIMVGKPVVKGTRIPVERVLEQLAYKFDLDELFEMFPELTPDDVRACLEYARATLPEGNSEGKIPLCQYEVRQIARRN